MKIPLKNRKLFHFNTKEGRSITFQTEAYLGPCEVSGMERFC